MKLQFHNRSRLGREQQNRKKQDSKSLHYTAWVSQSNRNKHKKPGKPRSGSVCYRNYLSHTLREKLWLRDSTAQPRKRKRRRN
jgi:hypothetical protein